MTSVTIFNANYLAVQINVNNAVQGFLVAPAAAPGWIPQTPQTGAPTWSDDGPGQNVIGPGDNLLQITPTGRDKPYTTTMSLPDSTQWTALQLYIFFNSYHDVSWIALNAGEYIVGSIKLSSSAVAASGEAG